MDPLFPYVPRPAAGAWIADTIESARNGPWPRKEISVVDGGSTDQHRRRRRASRSVEVVTPRPGRVQLAHSVFLLSCPGSGTRIVMQEKLAL